MLLTIERAVNMNEKIQVMIQWIITLYVFMSWANKYLLTFLMLNHF